MPGIYTGMHTLYHPVYPVQSRYTHSIPVWGKSEGEAVYTVYTS